MISPPRDLPKPTEAELELLAALWERGSATVRDLFEMLNRDRPRGYTSVLKTLQIMTEKGLVERAEQGKAHVYRAAASQDETQSQMLRDLTTRLFAGSAAQLALHALSLEAVDADELREIRKLIDAKRAKP